MTVFGPSKKKYNAWFKDWLSRNTESLQDIQAEEDALFGPGKHYSQTERELYFQSERGELPLDEWQDNLHNNYLEKKAPWSKAIDAKISSSVVIGSKVSPGIISNDTNKETGITDTANETSVATELTSDISGSNALDRVTPGDDFKESEVDCTGVYLDGLSL